MLLVMYEKQQVTIKAKCKGVIRLLKIPITLSYEGFCDLLKNSFGISHCQLQYSDEEGDSVELGSQEELQEALKVGEKFGPLKVTLITPENPTMSAMMSKPSDITQSNTADVELPVEIMDSEVNTSSTQSPRALVEPLSTLTINEKPTPKPRPSRKSKIGFYSSLCSDVADIETVSPDPTEGGQDCDLLIQKNLKLKKSPKSKTLKEAKPQRGSKYYASLADDIAAMKLIKLDQGQPVERKEMKRRAPSRKKEISVTKHDLQSWEKKQNLEKIEKDMKDISISDDEPPKWFDKVVHEMSQSVSTQVLGALNGAGIAVNGCPVKPMKQEGASYIHDGITCNGCQQIVIGPRYKCGNCPDFDLCEQCEVIEGIHESSHVFVKLRYPGIGIGRKHGVMIPLLKDIIYKSDDIKLADEQDKKMKEVRKKLKQLAKKKREEQVRIKKAEKKMKKINKGSSNISGQQQNAVCDLELAFLGDGSYPDGTAVTPSFQFTKCWKIRNTGNVAWNDETQLMYMYGAMRCMSSNEVPLPRLQPGQEGTVNVTFLAPAELGQYFSVWRASHNGKNFGTKMWCKIKVVLDEAGTDDDEETFVDASDQTTTPVQEASTEPADSAPCAISHAEIMNEESSPTTAEDPDSIFHAYTVQESREDETGAVNSSENQATTSHVSLLECTELEWDTCIIDDDGSPSGIRRDTFSEDDTLDIEVISNASSDDFCVVPLPACFDPDIPLNVEDFEGLQGSPVDPLVSLAQEMDSEISLGSLVDHQQQDHMESDEQNSEEPQSTAIIESPPQNATMDPQEESGSSEEDVRVITVIPERPTSPVVDDLRERDQLTNIPSIPINIGVKSAERLRGNRHPLSMSGFDVRSTISEPVAPQPPSLERTPLIPGRLPGSPPGRAVPVVRTQVTSPPATGAYSVPGSYEVHVASSSEQGMQWQAVRTQPSESMVLEETVTIQPQAGSSPNSARSTAQFASTLVTGTLKRALGTVTDTVTSFMTGKDPTVVYISPSSSHADDSVHVIVPEIVEPLEENQDVPAQQDSPVLIKQLQEMGFCDRQLNERLLNKHNMDVSKVVTELLHENDNDWSTGRH